VRREADGYFANFIAKGTWPFEQVRSDAL